MNTTALHQPVMVEEVINNLNVEKGQWYLDATFGRGGHTRRILEAGGKVLALDHDQSAIDYAQAHFEKEIQEKQLIVVRENFNKLTDICAKTLPNTQFAGMLFDFGTSVDQLKDDQRGFSFDSDAELDMRMDDRLGVKAKDLLAILPEKQLEDLFRNEGGEEEARGIARKIVKDRLIEPITTTTQLVDLISRVKQKKSGGLNPATKVFQALRIAVNLEMENISESLPQAIDLLKNGGYLVTISFHEGEDRIVKQLFKKWESESVGTLVFKKPQGPTDEEIQANPRARSAKLRAFIKKI